MKVHISVDMEGIACVTNVDDVRLEGPYYEKARHWMTAEANAAIEGAFECGATEVVVADSHGSMRNLIPDELHEDVYIVRGSPRPLTMMEGIDETFDAAIFVGYHSMAGNHIGNLSHTYLGSQVISIKINDVLVGEPGLNAAIAGHFGVPVILACGDDTVEKEIKEICPWAKNVTTKWAYSTFSSKNLTPKASQKKIKESTKEALDNLKDMKPFYVGNPVKMELVLFKAMAANLAADIPGVTQKDGRTLEFIGKDMIEVVRIFRVICNTILGDFFV
ncbi:MAG: M55 family metallopeptidase [Anaerolineaceae bacterium]|nr:M55 family metallopeptidase [Anaerolineaceae bacterium]